jgi:hypothetical protein
VLRLFRDLQALIDVLTDNQEGDLAQAGSDGIDLQNLILAITILFDHCPNAPNLTLDTIEALYERGFLVICPTQLNSVCFDLSFHSSTPMEETNGQSRILFDAGGGLVREAP